MPKLYAKTKKVTGLFEQTLVYIIKYIIYMNFFQMLKWLALSEFFHETDHAQLMNPK